MSSKILTYDTQKYPFRKHVTNLLKIISLEQLHEFALPSDLQYHTKETGDKTSLHKRFYDQVKDSAFMDCYITFIHEIVKPYFGWEIVYQAQPTFRIQFVNNRAVEPHRDADYNHPIQELNWWLPVTNTFGTNSIWIESKRGKRDYHPERVNYGEVLLFSGADLMHCNKTNDSGITRVSFDFRAMPRTEWVIPTEVKEGLTFKRKYTIGETDEYYYRETKPCL